MSMLWFKRMLSNGPMQYIILLLFFQSPIVCGLLEPHTHSHHCLKKPICKTQNSKQHDFIFCGSINHYNHPSLSRNRTVEFDFAGDTGYKAPADARMALEPKMEEVKAGEGENGLLLPADRRCVFLV